MAGERPTQETYDEGRLAERIMLGALAHGMGSSVGWVVGGGGAAAKELLGTPESRTVRTAISLWATRTREPDAPQAPDRRASLARQRAWGEVLPAHPLNAPRSNRAPPVLAPIRRAGVFSGLARRFGQPERKYQPRGRPRSP